MARKQLLTSADGVPATCQHEKPCSDCPWARASLPGWLGDLTAEEWLKEVHHPGDARVDCHVFLGAQCAGVSIYRANVLKKPRPGSGVLELPKNQKLVFRTPAEFLAHHVREKE